MDVVALEPCAEEDENETLINLVEVLAFLSSIIRRKSHRHPP